MSVAVIVSDAERAAAQADWAGRLADLDDRRLLVFCFAPDGSRASVERVDPEAPGDDALIGAVRDAVARRGDRGRLYGVRGHLAEGLLRRELGRRAPSLVIVTPEAESLFDHFFADASLDVVGLSATEGPPPHPAMGVLAIGARHGVGALRLAHRLRRDDGRLALLDVPPDDPHRVDPGLLARSVPEGGGLDVLPPILANEEGAGEPEQRFDLILAGTDDPVLAKRVLRGSGGRAPAAGAVAVLRSRATGLAYLRARLAVGLRRFVPRLERASRVELYGRIERGSVLGLDFVVLILLATAIASLGLIKDSGAVVIGAMLVAPLMTPMIGAGLALVQGNIVLARRSFWSIAVGFFLSLVISAVIAWLAPPPVLTDELLARGGATDHLDLAIALLSGFAAAWASSRPGLIGALPGVAIAAALVPPVATVGISAVVGEWTNAWGAARLFVVNLVAIVFASALALLVLGIRPTKRENRVPAWATWGVGGALILTIMVALPLRSPASTTWLRVEELLHRRLASQREVALDHLRVTREAGRATVTLFLITSADLAPDVVAELERLVRREMPGEPLVRVVTLRATRAR